MQVEIMEKVKPQSLTQKGKLHFKISKKNQFLEDIRVALNEIKEAKQKGTELQDMDDFLDECKNQSN